MSSARVRLYTKYEEKDEVNALGAKWDAEEKAWFIPTDFTGKREVFKKWLTKPIELSYTGRALADPKARKFFGAPVHAVSSNGKRKLGVYDHGESAYSIVLKLTAQLSKQKTASSNRDLVIDDLMKLIGKENEKSYADSVRIGTGLCLYCREPVAGCECEGSSDDEISDEVASDSDTDDEHEEQEDVSVDAKKQRKV